MQAALRLDGRLDMVLLADRDAAGGEDQVVLPGGIGQRRADLGGAVREDAEIGYMHAELSQRREQGITDGIHGRAWRKIGRARCRERGSTLVYIRVRAESRKKK